jgi:hypothetical protein
MVGYAEEMSTAYMASFLYACDIIWETNIDAYS